MTKCTTLPIDFTTCKRRLVQADFSDGDITSDGGAVLLREMYSRLELTGSIAQHLPDNRRKKQVRHDYLSLLRQRVYAMCLGYEDLNDHDVLRKDSVLALLVGMFLIFNAMNLSLLQRRLLLGRLRAVGVTPPELFRAVMLEALVLGVVGTLVGLLLGLLIGQGLELIREPRLERRGVGKAIEQIEGAFLGCDQLAQGCFVDTAPLGLEPGHRAHQIVHPLCHE
mgnify:CR=1 FL=1